MASSLRTIFPTFVILDFGVKIPTVCFLLRLIVPVLDITELFMALFPFFANIPTESSEFKFIVPVLERFIVSVVLSVIPYIPTDFFEPFSVSRFIVPVFLATVLFLANIPVELFPLSVITPLEAFSTVLAFPYIPITESLFPVILPEFRAFAPPVADIPVVALPFRSIFPSFIPLVAEPSIYIPADLLSVPATSDKVTVPDDVFLTSEPFLPNIPVDSAPLMSIVLLFSATALSANIPTALFLLPVIVSLFTAFNLVLSDVLFFIYIPSEFSISTLTVLLLVNVAVPVAVFSS